LSVTSNTTITTSDQVIIVEGSGTAITVTLPTPVGNTGKKFEFLIQNNIGGFSGTATLSTPAGSFLFPDSTSPASSMTFYNKSDQFALISDGSNWIVYSYHPYDWEHAATITYSGFGTVSADDEEVFRVGGFVEINGHFTCGTVAGTTAYIQLPANMAVDTLKIFNATTSGPCPIVGSYSFNSANSCGYLLAAVSTDATRVYFGNSYDTSTTTTPQTGTTLAASSNFCAYRIRIPVAVLFMEP
jgi:hypothetical protein